MSPSFVTKVDLNLSEKMKKDLLEQGFSLTTPPYTLFTAKKKGVTCTLYTSGKLVVQGKEKSSFIEFYLEPVILKEFSYTQPESYLDLSSRIGIDESGKGDFFGPLCIAGVFANEKTLLSLQKLGIADSKTLSAKKIEVFAREIQRLCAYHIVQINPPRYNELHKHFGNLNTLLAWGHATTIERLVTKTQCKKVIIDQFAHESVVKKALKEKKITVDLTQRHRAEEDLAVAAASILARWAFVEGLKKLEKEFHLSLPKGASSSTIKAGKALFQQFGWEGLKKCAKLHFKTLDAILGNLENGNSHE